MRAAVARRFGPPEVIAIERLPVPTPKADEVLVRVHATTVSIADHRLRAKDLPKGLGYFGPLALGVFRPRKKVLGMEASGVIEQVGADVTDYGVGDEVIVMNGSKFGCHAEFVTARAHDSIARKPAGLSHADAAALVFGGFTAVSFLGRVKLGPGSEVLVNGASGAVGTAVVQLAAHAGARVTAVTSGPQRRTGPVPRGRPGHRLHAAGLRREGRALRRHRRVRRQCAASIGSGVS